MSTGIKVQIVGPHDKDGNFVPLHLHDGDGDSPGVIAFTHPLYHYNAESRPFSNDIYGTDMAQNASFGGTPIPVHNGIDNAYWTGSQIVGTNVTFDSTDVGKVIAGAKSIKVANPASNDVWQFAKGSTQDLTGHTAITFKINIDSGWTEGDSVSICGYDVSGDAIVGVAVLIEDYMNEFEFDATQTVSIPFSDMALESQTIEAFRMTQVSKHGQAATFYMDTFQIEETGDSIEFRVSAQGDGEYHVTKLRIAMANNVGGTVADGTMSGIAYDSMLGVTLTNGLSFRQVVNGETLFAPTWNTVGDLMAAGFDLVDQISDGTNTMLIFEVEFSQHNVYRGNPSQNYAAFVINDDLTSFLQFGVVARGARVTNKDLL